MSNICTSVSPLEYQDVGGDSLALPQMSAVAVTEFSSPTVIGVSEEEVARRVQIAREAATAEADGRMRIECEHANKIARDRVTEVLKRFEGERADYFRHVEAEVVQLALAIARKILHREAELDPTLLAALVRIALDQMQCKSVVRVRVSAENADQWRRCGDASTGLRWEITSDEALTTGDCIVETELGTADFGFEAQLRGVEESFAQLLSHRPDAQSHHVARA